MDSDDAEEVNTQIENRYIKDAKVGEGTYAVVYSGTYVFIILAVLFFFILLVRSFR